MYEHDWYKELWYAQGSDMTGAQGKSRNETNKLDADKRVEEAKGSDLDGRDGEEKGQSLREKKEERRGLAEDRIEQRAERRQKR